MYSNIQSEIHGKDVLMPDEYQGSCDTESSVQDFTTWEYDDLKALPLVMDVNDIANVTRIGRDKIYRLMKRGDGGIPRIAIGNGEKKKYLVYKYDLLRWLKAATRENADFTV